MSNAAGAPEATPEGLIQLGGVPPIGRYVRSIWERREFAASLALGELRSMHMDTVLGAFWHLLNPILLTAVYYVVFELVLNVGSARGHENYIAFLSIGIFSYSYSQRCVMFGAGAITSNIGLIRSLQFPRALLPIAAVMRETIAYGYALFVVLLILGITREPLTPSWLMFLAILALQIVFNIGAALLASRLSEQVRDIQNVLPFLFRLTFYFSGTLFDVEKLLGSHEDLLWIFTLNPFFAFTSLPRQYLLSEPQSDLLPLMWISALAWTAVLLVVGLVFFRGGEHQYGRR